MTAIHPLPLILASESKSRERLLLQTGIKFTKESPKIDEKSIVNTVPAKRTCAIAIKKAEACHQKLKGEFLIVSADTVVIHNNTVLEKPKYKMTAVSMLKELSGSIHTVLTGWAVYNTYKDIWHTGYSETYVTFRELYYQEIVNYVNSYPVTTWAAGYNPQLSSAIEFINKVDGSLSGLNGLPLDQIMPILHKEWAHPYKKREKGQ